MRFSPRQLSPAWTPDPQDGPETTGIKVAVIGAECAEHLDQRLLGENRMVAFDQPGTTRDAVLVPFERDGERYTLIDTAGLRRRSRVEKAVENSASSRLCRRSRPLTWSSW